MKRLIENMRTWPRGMKAADAVRVDRGTRWGNPFILGTDGDRNRVCDLFRAYAAWRLTIQPDWLAPLKDRDLACWCAPERCHAETLMELANQTHKASEAAGRG